MKRENGTLINDFGFSLIELVVVMIIMGVMASIAFPAFSAWLPNYRLRVAANDLYSDLQLTKLTAVKQNATSAVIFDTGASPGKYFICSDPGANGNWDGPAAMGGEWITEPAMQLMIFPEEEQRPQMLLRTPHQQMWPFLALQEW